MGTPKVQILNFGYTKAEFDALLASKEDFAKADNHEKRLSNIEEHLNPKYINTDETIARWKEVPTDACSLARINSIGGMTYRDEVTNTLVDAKVTELKHVGNNLYGGDALASAIHKSVTGAAWNKDNKTISFHAKNAKMFKAFGFDPNTQYTVILYGMNDASSTYSNLRIFYTDGTSEWIHFKTAGQYSYAIVTSQVNKSIARIGGAEAEGRTYLRYDLCGIFKGKISADQFEPYEEKPLFKIPQSVMDRCGDDYGKGINETYYNKVVWEDNKVYYHHTCRGIVLDGSSDEGWGLRTNVTTEGRRYFYKTLTQDESVSLNGIGISNNYELVEIKYTNEVKGFNVAPYGGKYSVIVRPDDIATLTLEEFTARLAENPLVVVYGVDTTKTDITDLFTDKNIIEVTAGGSIEFVNVHGRAVPSSITYLLKDK